MARIVSGIESDSIVIQPPRLGQSSRSRMSARQYHYFPASCFQLAHADKNRLVLSEGRAAHRRSATLGRECFLMTGPNFAERQSGSAVTALCQAKQSAAIRWQ
jgi:hypothetical protein